MMLAQSPGNPYKDFLSAAEKILYQRLVLAVPKPSPHLHRGGCFPLCHGAELSDTFLSFSATFETLVEVTAPSADFPGMSATL
ncbi:hypothetical protein COCNU_07G015450 [Cocos nucifera]|uniref:Uncharacterized protein n=1 Tax=Cocos nucifera TaxID=13894 RepID=A0A8K0IGP2_COCNU|nr:hypothetical protein COCNU_07G015450 [Cocos nucifera]